MDEKRRTSCTASQEMLTRAACDGIETAWDRHEAMEPQCGYGMLGICCRICAMGPCRINPFSEEEGRGVCGATADTIAARNLVRMIAAGAAAHSDHGRDVAHTLVLTADKKSEGYSIKDPVKLLAVAKEMGIKTGNRDLNEIAHDVGETAYNQFGQQEGELIFGHRAPKKQQEIWRKLNVFPRGIDREIVEVMHRTNIGVDCDYKNIIQGGMRAALGDGWGGSMIATDLQDILLGSPLPLRSQVNLGVFKDNTVNMVVHGHEPVLSDLIATITREPEMIEAAKEAGAEGITVGGICCTANEILMRQGFPIAGNFLQQELAILTGAIDAMVVDVQCIMPNLTEVSKRFHTKVITTSPKAKYPDVEHIEFHEENAYSTAKEIVKTAIDNFKNRDRSRVQIPHEKMDLVAGFTAENINWILGGKYRGTYRPLNDAIIAGRVRGVAAVVGCNNPKIEHDTGHYQLVKELLKKDVLVLETGCAAIACAKCGMLIPESIYEYAGKGLRETCEAVGIPPVLHFGSCVDISRLLMAAVGVVRERGCGDDISELPLAAAAPEWMSEKAVSIGFYAVASGIFTVLGVPFPVLGAPNLTRYLTEELENIVGARFAFESDPVKAARLMIEHIDKKRVERKMRPMLYAEGEGQKAEAKAEKEMVTP
ncbi:MAG: anaerobic carbon-monoxide dehydrogenase catalytic subunit [Chloroflexi bacterium]|nr:anaerobic carbon-monoxide dehydrogenase catalytic subunit [Chloroflexota bacterium]